MRIAIIGSGIAGMTAALRLHQQGHEITVYEANDYYGGHTATIDIERDGRQWAIDTGFIVFNDWTYPNFIALLDELQVEWQYSDMSFSLRCERTGLEYNGTSLNSLFAQRLNVLRPSFLRMIYDILRFNGEARALLKEDNNQLTLSAYLQRHGYSRAFTERYIVPMGRAIWSATETSMLDFPAHFFVEFFDRHGFLNVSHRPVWRAIKGGSREYARKLVASYQHRIRLRTPITGVKREAKQVLIRTRAGDIESHDCVVLACHSDQALRLLEQPSQAEREVLGAFPYQENEVLLHTDTRMLPRKPLARAAWNYHLLAESQDRVTLTYDMNILQNLSAPEKFLVTLNRSQHIDPAKVLGSYVYHHPVYTPGAVAAQQRYTKVNGVNRTFYCGAYWGYGFHEDGVVSAQRMLRAFAKFNNFSTPFALSLSKGSLPQSGALRQAQDEREIEQQDVQPMAADQS
ncbi:MAG: NAD(P)/FAD-dependent oxidoreductase [Steroidobacteraceae bacterium]